jgi:hypothetical protein
MAAEADRKERDLMAIIPAYLVYGPRKSRLLVGESGYTWEGDYVFLELEFD